ncbi:hypothetical protein CkaCkLH20_09562 [Colletotrichum karsti]|uniref:Secreted protein n=1 Tax=Colletotrichum karsti TaxID=1095194 RepID=A0A9P6HZK9_9PEZI|nr:uncharacterized protein CkaCkLH20_09562 [Colletotrichum karsti]KAF9873052.1 hypothetical protein CkaCkLH20_09562 [Colletotrichum karsti]
MYFSSLLLGLAATASAIDLRAHPNDGCTGSYSACVNLNPNVCCSFSSSSTSGKATIAVVAIPSNWRIRAESWTGGGCRFTGGSLDSGGSTTICLPYSTRGDRTGGSYFFLSRKRANDESCPAEQPGAGKCEAVVKPNVVGLADGTEYGIAGLTDEKIQELMLTCLPRLKENIANTGAGADAVPAEFQILRR